MFTSQKAAPDLSKHFSIPRDESVPKIPDQVVQQCLLHHLAAAPEHVQAVPEPRQNAFGRRLGVSTPRLAKGSYIAKLIKPD